MSDVIPPPPPTKSDSGGCWKWVAIGCISVGCLCVLAVGAIVIIFMRSPMVQQMKQTVTSAPRVERDLIQIGAAITSYHEAKGKYPEKLAELAPKYLAAPLLHPSAAGAGPYVYKKPAKDSPPDFAIVTVDLPMPPPYSQMTIRLLKDGRVEGADAWVRQHQPGAFQSR